MFIDINSMTSYSRSLLKSINKRFFRKISISLHIISPKNIKNSLGRFYRISKIIVFLYDFRSSISKIIVSLYGLKSSNPNIRTNDFNILLAQFDAITRSLNYSARSNVSSDFSDQLAFSLRESIFAILPDINPSILPDLNSPSYLWPLGHV